MICEIFDILFDYIGGYSRFFKFCDDDLFIQQSVVILEMKTNVISLPLKRLNWNSMKIKSVSTTGI